MGKTSLYLTKHGADLLEMHQTALKEGGKVEIPMNQLIFDCLAIAKLYLEDQITFENDSQELEAGMTNKLIYSKRSGQNALSNAVQNKPTRKDPDMGDVG